MTRERQSRRIAGSGPAKSERNGLPTSVAVALAFRQSFRRADHGWLGQSRRAACGRPQGKRPSDPLPSRQRIRYRAIDPHAARAMGGSPSTEAPARSAPRKFRRIRFPKDVEFEIAESFEVGIRHPIRPRPQPSATSRSGLVLLYGVLANTSVPDDAVYQVALRQQACGLRARAEGLANDFTRLNKVEHKPPRKEVGRAMSGTKSMSCTSARSIKRARRSSAGVVSVGPPWTSVWWLFERQESDMAPGSVCRRFYCSSCWSKKREKVHDAHLHTTNEKTAADPFRWPDERTWKELVSRFRT